MPVFLFCPVALYTGIITYPEYLSIALDSALFI